MISAKRKRFSELKHVYYMRICFSNIKSQLICRTKQPYNYYFTHFLLYAHSVLAKAGKTVRYLGREHRYRLLKVEEEELVYFSDVRT